MSDNRQIAYDAHSFTIRGNREFLIGGEFHYFRTPNELWEDRLIKMKRCGANLVTTYIPWNWHEPREGQQRWTGDCDVARFIELCTKHGLFVIVKPGPYCCAEWDFGGHPDWLLSKNIPLRVLNDKYLEYVRAWYKKVAEVISPYLATKGGNVFCIQVENEYDHLMEYGEEKISKEDAIKYFTRLGGMMEEFGIDIPKFANEAGFLRGKGNIIDTRTYYPNIPLFQFWMYMHKYFDGKILAAKQGQPNCPTMILELQVGWFAQFGRPLYIAPVHLTESVSKSVVGLGASVLNYYMYVGGTTVPFWGCRGNIWDIHPRGTGTATTFDFGGSPIREWGELMPGRMDFIRALSEFGQDFKQLVLEASDTQDFKVLKGGEGISIIKPGATETDIALQGDTENFQVYARKLGDQYLVCVRNLSADTKVVDIGFAKTGQVVFQGLELQPRQTFLLPVNVKIPGSTTVIESSTSELLFARKVNSHSLFGIYGKPGAKGRTVLKAAGAIKVLSGDVQVNGNVLEYTHKGIQVVQVGSDRMFILDQDLCGKIEELDGGIVVADTYFIRDIQQQGKSVTLKAQMRSASKNTFTFFDDKPLAEVKIAGKPVELVRGEDGRTTFSYRNSKQKAVKLEWTGDWKLKTDTAEIATDYQPPQGWTTLPEPISLEEAGLLQHGYIWYRGEFDLPADAESAEMVYPGNDCDRQHVFVNGQRVWDGIDGDHTIGLQNAMKPGRNVVAVLYENFFHSKSHPHEGAIRKYSGILKSVLITGKTKSGQAFTREIKSFQVRQQLAELLRGCTELKFNDADWQVVKPARRYVLDEKLGVISWMRRTFKYQCKKGWEVAVRITLPEVKQRCLVYINGKPVAQYDEAGPQHDFYVPAPYLQKNNVIAICLEGSRSTMIEPELGTFYEVKDVDIEMTLG
ncbi:MAG TPA: beta-galactosidase [Kiritimatiellia bacterium]|nr:beta-galactosidase [Kiritimatiellia bacterium]